MNQQPYQSLILSWTFFLKLVSLEDSKATSIVTAIESYFSQSSLSINQLSSFGSDSAAVMIGFSSHSASASEFKSP